MPIIRAQVVFVRRGSLAQDTQIFCGCKPAGLCLKIIRVPVGAFERAAPDEFRLVAEEHVDELPGRVVERGTGYAVVEWRPVDEIRPPRRHTRRRDGSTD
jgi:hypothetical protein